MRYFIYYLIVINVIGFILFYIDKRKAINNQYRVSEKMLLCISLIGGGIGSYCSMYIFRHKIRNIKFVVGIPIITLLFIFLTYFIYINFSKIPFI